MREFQHDWWWWQRFPVGPPHKAAASANLHNHLASRTVWSGFLWKWRVPRYRYIQNNEIHIVFCLENEPYWGFSGSLVSGFVSDISIFHSFLRPIGWQGCSGQDLASHAPRPQGWSISISKIYLSGSCELMFSSSSNVLFRVPKKSRAIAMLVRQKNRTYPKYNGPWWFVIVLCIWLKNKNKF